VYDRFRRYRIEGFFAVILARLQLGLNKEGLIDFSLWEVDSTTVRAHRPAAGAGLKRGSSQARASQSTMRWGAAEAVSARRFTG
jgi:hypothetical protein